MMARFPWYSGYTHEFPHTPLLSLSLLLLLKIKRGRYREGMGRSTGEGVPSPVPTCTQSGYTSSPTTSQTPSAPVRSAVGPRKADSPPGAQVRAHPRQRPRHRSGTGLLIVCPVLRPQARPRFQAPRRRSRLSLPDGAAAPSGIPSPLFWGPFPKPPHWGRSRAGSASRGMPRQTPANVGFVRVNPCPASRENARPARSSRQRARRHCGPVRETVGASASEPEPQQKERSEHTRRHAGKLVRQVSVEGSPSNGGGMGRGFRNGGRTGTTARAGLERGGGCSVPGGFGVAASEARRRW
jgi:hypothetical protein